MGFRYMFPHGGISDFVERSQVTGNPFAPVEALNGMLYQAVV